MNFGGALERLKDGSRVCRKGWNGSGMWLILVMPGSRGEDSLLLSHAGTWELGLDEELGGEDFQQMGVDPCIVMKTAGGTIQPGWLASQADMLAEDWEVVSG